MAEIETNNDFAEKVLKFTGLALVEFYSETCVPCKRMAPVLTEIENEYPQGLLVAKVNVSRDIAPIWEYNITAVPTILLFKNGEVVERVAGVLKKEELERLISLHS